MLALELQPGPNEKLKEQSHHPKKARDSLFALKGINVYVQTLQYLYLQLDMTKRNFIYMTKR